MSRSSLPRTTPRPTHRMRELGVERVRIRIDRSGLNPFADLKLLAELSQAA